MNAFATPSYLYSKGRALGLCSVCSIRRRASAKSAGAIVASLDDVDLSPKRDGPKSGALNIFRELFAEVLDRPPPPVVLARRTVDQDFAVLLMRSGYNAVDTLDFVGMDEFQARFFHIRANEWEKFIQANVGMRQGVISDPRYFDFISFAQMLTIQFFIRDPRAIFEERYGDEDGKWYTRVVRRDVGRLATPRDILQAWRSEVGKRIYQRVVDNIRRPQAVADGDRTRLVDGIRDIYEHMEICGFCLKSGVSESEDGKTLTVEMVGPCILWGAKALKQRRGIPNDYDCYAVEAFCQASGVFPTYKTKFSENSIARVWKV